MVCLKEKRDGEKKLFTEGSRCKDYDEDCLGCSYTACWLYDPEQGWCPFLINKESE